MTERPTEMPETDYTPDIPTVAAMIRERTVNAGGDEVGTFDATTRPTDAEVTSLIQDAVNEAYPVFGADIPDAPGSEPNALRNAAQRAVAFRAAALVEQTYFGEEVARGTSPFDQLQQSWNDNLNRISKAIEGTGGTVPGGGTGASLDAYFDFPEDAGGMVGWGTRW